MFRSIRTRLIVLCLLLVLATAGSLMWFAHKDTIAALRGSERRTLNNVLSLLEQELSAAHTEALRGKVAAVATRKKNLQRTAKAVVSMLGSVRELPKTEQAQFVRLWAATLVDQAVSVTIYTVDTYRAESFTGGHSLPSSLQARLPALATTGQGEFFWEGFEGGTLTWFELSGDMLVVCTSSLKDLEDAAQVQMAAVSSRFSLLLDDVRIQKTGFAAVFDEQGGLITGPAHAVLPEGLRYALTSATFVGASRRVMVLPASSAPEAGEIFYLMSYFPPLRWHIILAAPLDELEAPAFALVGGQMALTAGVMLVALLAGFVFSGRISGPIRQLAQVLRSFPERDLVTLDTEALTKELPVRHKDEVGELARSFAHLAHELHYNVNALLQATELRQRLESELQVARDIQYGILPVTFPQRPEFDLYACMYTAKEVGGDLYDFFFLDANRLCLVLGDVSDKGIPAALFMSMAVTLVRATMGNEGASPQKAMGSINDTLARDNPRSMFVTLIIGVLDLPSGKLEWASAGHMPPVVVNATGASNLPASEDMVAGAFEGIPYKCLQATLLPGDTLFLYTDGVSEGMNEQKELFGEARLLQFLASHQQNPAKELSEALIQAVAQHAAGEEQSDDITLLALRYKPTAI